MKTLYRAIFAAMLLPLSVFANTLVISASGRGTSAIAAVAAAKRQIVADALSAGFFSQNGYRICATRTVDVTRVGSAYLARVDADLARVTETKRVAFLVSGDEGQTSRLLSLVQRMRAVLNEHRTATRANIEVLDARATGNLRLTSLDDLQRPELDAELAQMSQAFRASVIYLLAETDELGATLLVAYRTGKDAGLTIRTLRFGEDANTAPWLAQFVDAIRQDVEPTERVPDRSSTLTLSTTNTLVRKGQSVVIYADKTVGGADRDFPIVTHGVVTEVSGSRVRVLAEKPVTTDSKVKLLLSTLPKRGVVITEADW